MANQKNTKKYDPRKRKEFGKGHRESCFYEENTKCLTRPQSSVLRSSIFFSRCRSISTCVTSHADGGPSAGRSMPPPKRDPWTSAQSKISFPQMFLTPRARWLSLARSSLLHPEMPLTLPSPSSSSGPGEDGPIHKTCLRLWYYLLKLMPTSYPWNYFHIWPLTGSSPLMRQINRCQRHHFTDEELEIQKHI